MNKPAVKNIGKNVGQLPARRHNRRAESTIATILAATEEMIVREGVEHFSILDVCKHANVSRGTFYRYFSSQDELLDAFSRYRRENFHYSMMDAVTPFDDPDERFQALVRYLQDYAAHGHARLLLRAAPEYTLRFFVRIFHESQVRIQEVLESVFNAWESRMRIRIDRELVCEMLIRYVLSEQVAPRDRTDGCIDRVEQLFFAVMDAHGKGRGRHLATETAARS